MLAARFDASEPVVRQLVLIESQISKVRQIALHRLEPAAPDKYGAHAWILKLRDIEGKH